MYLELSINLCRRYTKPDLRLVGGEGLCRIGLPQLAISLEIREFGARLQFGTRDSNLSLSLFAHIAPMRYHHPIISFEVF